MTSEGSEIVSKASDSPLTCDMLPLSHVPGNFPCHPHMATYSSSLIPKSLERLQPGQGLSIGRTAGKKEKIDFPGFRTCLHLAASHSTEWATDRSEWATECFLGHSFLKLYERKKNCTSAMEDREVLADFYWFLG